MAAFSHPKVTMTPSMRLLLLMSGGQTLLQQVLAQYVSAPKGMLLLPTAATGFSDNPPVTPAVLDGPIGTRNSLAGNVPLVLQGTSAARPTWKLNGAIYSDLMDGTDDGYATAAFAAGTLTADMDCFIAVKRNSAAKAVLIYDTTVAIFAVWSAGDAGGASSASGTPTYYVNNVAVPGGTGTTRDQLNTAVTVGSWVILEVRNLNLSAWVSLGIGVYGGWPTNGNVGGVILAEAGSTAQRNINYNYLASLAGLAAR